MCRALPSNHSNQLRLRLLVSHLFVKGCPLVSGCEPMRIMSISSTDACRASRSALIHANAIEITPSHTDAVSPAFVDSIRRLGVLQPLLVAAQGGRYRVIAGRRRLAAALSAGLREVPCLVQHVDAEHAEQMALASTLAGGASRPASPAISAPEKPRVASELNFFFCPSSCAYWSPPASLGPVRYLFF